MKTQALLFITILGCIIAGFLFGPKLSSSERWRIIKERNSDVYSNTMVQVYGRIFRQKNIAEVETNGSSIIRIWRYTGPRGQVSELLILDFHKNGIISGEFFSLKLASTDKDVQRQATPDLSIYQSDAIKALVNKYKFWNSGNCLGEENGTGDDWFIEGKRDNQIVRWKCYDSEQTRPAAKLFGSEVYKILGRSSDQHFNPYPPAENP